MSGSYSGYCSNHNDKIYNGKTNGCLIQRMLVIHLNLYESCMQGTSLGEGASLEELSEQILYYHRDQFMDNDIDAGSYSFDAADSNNHNQQLLEEAVQFLGLSIALYSLPSSFQGMAVEKDSEAGIDEIRDKTQSIYFEQSTMVFVPLEKSASPSFYPTEEIVAVVQVARSTGGGGGGGGGYPLAIRTSIERSYQLFTMLHGGRIFHRLKGNTNPDEEQQLISRMALSITSHSCPYQGMDTLFEQLKQMRKLKESMARSAEDEDETIQRQIHSLTQTIRSLRQDLPIQSVRRDLDAHFKEYLADVSTVTNRVSTTAAGRCMVEIMPVPIAQIGGNHTIQLPPSFATPKLLKSLGDAIHQVLDAHAPPHNNDPAVLAITTFHNGQLIDRTATTRPSSTIHINNVIVTLLMAYMASYQAKINALTASTLLGSDGEGQSLGPSDCNIQGGIRSFTRSIGLVTGPLSKDNEASMQRRIPSSRVESESNPQQQQYQFEQHRGWFLSTPPSFMLSANHQTYSIHNGKHSIWMPQVHLPSTSDSLPSNHHLQSTSNNNNIHMVMFQFLEFSFLVFINLPPQSMELESDNKARLLLMKLEEELSEAVLFATTEEENNNDSQQHVLRWTNTPGEDILLLERDRHRLVLFQDPTGSSPRRQQQQPQQQRDKWRSQKSQPRRFLGIGPKTLKEPSVKQLKTTSQSSQSEEWSLLGLDCRHMLASRLPLDVCLAFDDMIQEMTIRRKNGKYTDSAVELCTCLPHGWVYAFMKDDKEVYAFFHNSIYVTVADVKASARRIWESFSGTAT